MIEEHDIVVLTRDLPSHKLCKGDIGTVVYVHGDRAAYEVEFITLGGSTLAIVTLAPEAVRAATDRDIAKRKGAGRAP